MGRMVAQPELARIRAQIPKGKTVVLATGVFDVLHREHRRLVRKAKSQGDILIVGVEPDVRARALKGEGRPLHPQEKRVAAVSALPGVDYAFILPSNLGTKPGREELVRSLRPQIYAVSQSTPFREEKERIMHKFGGEVRVVLEHNPRHSTTQILKKRYRRARR